MTDKKTTKVSTKQELNKYDKLQKRVQRLEGKILSLQKKAKGKETELKHDTIGRLNALLDYLKLKTEYIDGKPIVSENRSKKELKARERQVLASHVGI